MKLTISHVNQLTQPKNNDENPNSWLGIFEKMLDKKRSVLIVVQLLRVYHVCVCVCVFRLTLNSMRYTIKMTVNFQIHHPNKRNSRQHEKFMDA